MMTIKIRRAHDFLEGNTYMVKVVFFDIDNTLYNFNKADRLAMEAMYDYCEEHFQMNRDKAKSELKKAKDHVFNALPDRPAMHNRVLRYQYFLEENDLPLFPHTLNMALHYWQTLLDNMEIEPGIEDLMKAIRGKGCKVGIGTNMTSYVQFLKLDKLKLAGYIDFIVTSEEADREKPSEEFFKLVINKASENPDDIIFIGDNLELDAIGSSKCGMHGVLYAPPYLDEPASIPENGIIKNYADCITEDGIKLGNIML